MRDYTNRQAAELQKQSKTSWATRNAIINRSAAAEDTYREQFGPRPKTHHVQIRFAERKTPGWGISPKRFDYVMDYPSNVTIFATVAADGTTVFNGWNYHRDIIMSLVPGRDPNTYIFDGQLRPMSELQTAKVM